MKKVWKRHSACLSTHTERQASWAKSKQAFDTTLTIIGFSVDPNALTITLPSESKEKLVTKIDEFLAAEGTNKRFKVNELQRFVGYLNWSLNVFPFLKPALRPLYDKMRSKTPFFLPASPLLMPDDGTFHMIDSWQKNVQQTE